MQRVLLPNKLRDLFIKGEISYFFIVCFMSGNSLSHNSFMFEERKGGKRLEKTEVNQAGFVHGAYNSLHVYEFS